HSGSTSFPYTTLFRSRVLGRRGGVQALPGAPVHRGRAGEGREGAGIAQGPHRRGRDRGRGRRPRGPRGGRRGGDAGQEARRRPLDRKSTRLNSSHVSI